jgi:hypothetical protein
MRCAPLAPNSANVLKGFGGRSGSRGFAPFAIVVSSFGRRRGTCEPREHMPTQTGAESSPEAISMPNPRLAESASV